MVRKATLDESTDRRVDFKGLYIVWKVTHCARLSKAIKMYKATAKVSQKWLKEKDRMTKS